ncbi:MAG: hypothetical protein EPN34_02715 [Burkholderiaceae bacterium]|nr:MAG: hypothetical protein EPN34_02715 [Burkholderiaceae bacterium]
MLAAAILAVAILFVGWFWLLYQFHRGLDAIDPALSRQIGKPSLFWTAFNGHRILVELMRRSDLASSRYAPLALQARALRVYALLIVAAIAWMLWMFVQAQVV